MESSSCRSLELRVMHCKDLKAFNFFQKLSVYALVSLVTDDDPSMKKKLEQQQQQQRTPADTEGDKNPEWNHEMRFDLGGHGTGDECEYDDHLFLHFDLRSELTIFGHKSLGEVRVLIKDLINEEEEESAGDGIIRFVNYEVRTADGKPNGVLSFSYKLLNEYKGNGGKTFTKKKKNVHIDGYPVVNHINNDDDDHFHNRVDYPSLLPDDYLQIPLGSGTDQSQESYHLAAADASHRLHYPSMEIPPYPAAAGGGEGYRINYPQPYDQFHHHPPPPPFLHPHPHPHPPPPPPPPPFLHHPPPPPPHMVPGAGFYHSRSPWAHEHPYPN